MTYVLHSQQEGIFPGRDDGAPSGGSFGSRNSHVGPISILDKAAACIDDSFLAGEMSDLSF